MKLSFDFDRTGLEDIKIILHISPTTSILLHYEQSIFKDGSVGEIKCNLITL